MQQIILSGVGGQGVLYITKLLAETALDLGYSILISETHGMAQRGGNVVSHLKISERCPSLNAWKPAGTPRGFASPLVRPGQGDVLLSLHPEAILVHGYYLKPGGEAFCNTPRLYEADFLQSVRKSYLDANRIAEELGSPISSNLVLLGFAVGSGRLFCPPEALEKTLRRTGGKRLTTALVALQAGVNIALKTCSCPVEGEHDSSCLS